MQRHIAWLTLVLAACAGDSPPGQEIDFLRDPASGMCMPIQVCDAAGQCIDRKDAVWASWAPCPDPCAGLGESDCKADPRCEPDYVTTPVVCPKDSACQPSPPPTYAGCHARPVADACLGLDEKTCGATPGCRPIYGGVPCNCPDGDGSPPCACPAIAVYRGCTSEGGEKVCTSDAECPSGTRCSTDFADCRMPPGCSPGEPCVTICAGVCIAETTCVGDGDCRAGEHCSRYPCPVGVNCNKCIPDEVLGCFAIHDERSCIARADCEPVYVGERCFCDAEGCGCLDYTFDSCRPRPTPPPPTCDPKATLPNVWTSATAPVRSYSFAKDGSFVVTDAIAPCPPDAVCVWSGIVTARGTWALDASGLVKLAYTEPLPAEVQYPTALALKGCGRDALLVELDTGRTFRVGP